MAVRGSYSKGVAKREEILSVALKVIAAKGYGRTTVRDLAEAVGLTQAGLLHYFSSKEELFAEVLRARDEVDVMNSTGAGAPADIVDGFVSIVRHNCEVPGLVQLYARLSAEATDRSNASHDFFAERYRGIRDQLATGIRAIQDVGGAPQNLDADVLARILIALSDGLQTQWLIEPNFEMADVMGHLVDQLGIHGGMAGSAPG